MDWKDFLRRIFLIDLLKGLRLTFSYQRPDAICTEQYPLERPPVAERYRGAPRLNNHPESGETLCIACNLCSIACPENLIVVGWARTVAGIETMANCKGQTTMKLEFIEDCGGVQQQQRLISFLSVPRTTLGQWSILQHPHPSHKSPKPNLVLQSTKSSHLCWLHVLA